MASMASHSQEVMACAAMHVAVPVTAAQLSARSSLSALSFFFRSPCQAISMSAFPRLTACSLSATARCLPFLSSPRQAISMSAFPRLTVRHTSQHIMGQASASIDCKRRAAGTAVGCSLSDQPHMRFVCPGSRFLQPSLCGRVCRQAAQCRAAATVPHPFHSPPIRSTSRRSTGCC